MRKLFYLFFLLILITPILADNATILKVLFQSIEKTATVDLSKYLTGDQFFVNYSKNLDIKIKDNIATITAKEGWTGAELIIFSTNETTAVQPVIFVKSSKEIPKADLSEILTNLYINRSFLPLKDYHENLTNLDLTIYNTSSEILLNQDTLITLDFDYPIPIFSIEISLPTKEEPRPSSNSLPYLIGIIVLIIIIAILFTFKDLIMEKFKPKKEFLSKAKAKENALKKLNNLSLKGSVSKKIIRILKTFFYEAYNIKPTESYLKTISLLQKRKIPFSLKEDLANYYDRSLDLYTNKIKLKGKALEHFVNDLKELIKRT